MHPGSLPSLSNLPLRRDDRPFSAWGLYGDDDQLGALIRLAEELVKEVARDEIQSGPSSGRQPFHKDVLHKAPRIVNDDDNVNGIHAWSKKGIVGRGVLLDFHNWRLCNNIAYEPFKTRLTSLSQLKALLRTGYIAALNKMSKDQAEAYASVVSPTLSGVEQSEEMLEWIWNHFSAVDTDAFSAGDQPSFECWQSQREWHLHEILLSGWGLPTGELLDLENLSKHCKAVNRWSFFVSSEVCNVPGGVARYTSFTFLKRRR
ncbi:hypothetical protein BDR22DRAFT_882285 [Usnea florida]